MPQSKTALITGGSSGLGYEFAKLFAKDGYNLILVASNKEKLTTASKTLENEYNIYVKFIQKDLSIATNCQATYDEIKKEKIQIDILVNNAGFAKYGEFNEISLEESLSEINVNIGALTSLTRLFLPEMLGRKNGKILNVASTAAFAPGPMMSVYFATKAYVLSFSEALSEELKETGVSLTVLCPGPTTTGFAERAKVQNSNLYRKPMLANEVAKIGYEGLMRNQRIIIPGLNNNLFVQLLRIAPRSIVPGVVRKIW